MVGVWRARSSRARRRLGRYLMVQGHPGHQRGGTSLGVGLHCRTALDVMFRIGLGVVQLQGQCVACRVGLGVVPQRRADLGVRCWVGCGVVRWRRVILGVALR